MPNASEITVAEWNQHWREAIRRTIEEINQLSREGLTRDDEELWFRENMVEFMKTKIVDVTDIDGTT